MDFTKLMMITGMTMKDLKEIPKVALVNIITSLESYILNNYCNATKRSEIGYQIACYQELMLTAK